jgi:hypothetical protein
VARLRASRSWRLARILASQGRGDPRRGVERGNAASPQPGVQPGAVAFLTVLGAALRLSTLGAPSVWFDEAVTLSLVRMDLGEMLALVGPVSGCWPTSR